MRWLTCTSSGPYAGNEMGGVFCKISGPLYAPPAYGPAHGIMIPGTRHSDHISPVLRELIGYPSESASTCLVRQSLSGQAPLYLADDCRLVSDSTRRSLRSADVLTCMVPRTLSSYGDRTFAAAGPRLWNSLPVQLSNPDITYGLFRRQLKGHPFREA